MTPDIFSLDFWAAIPFMDILPFLIGAVVLFIFKDVISIILILGLLLLLLSMIVIVFFPILGALAFVAAGVWVICCVLDYFEKRK